MITYKRIKRWRRRSILEMRKLIWRLKNKGSKQASPVYIIGVQRSGTTMLGECLDESPEIIHYPEHDKNAFNNFILKDNKTILSLINKCRHKYVIFKPLTDSHRAENLLGISKNSKAIWMYRRYENRATSAVTKFGSHNLKLLNQFVKGENLSCWQAQGLDTNDIDLIKSFSPDKMSPESAALLFWYLRNNLFFKQHLDQRNDIALVSYESFVQNPANIMYGITRFIGIDYNDYLVAQVHKKSLPIRKIPKLEPRLVELCDDMYARLEVARKNKGIV